MNRIFVPFKTIKGKAVLCNTDRYINALDNFDHEIREIIRKYSLTIPRQEVEKQIVSLVEPDKEISEVVVDGLEFIFFDYQKLKRPYTKSITINGYDILL